MKKCKTIRKQVAKTQLQFMYRYNHREYSTTRRILQQQIHEHVIIGYWNWRLCNED